MQKYHFMLLYFSVLSHFRGKYCTSAFFKHRLFYKLRFEMILENVIHYHRHGIN